jgi:hypothetical protein
MGGCNGWPGVLVSIAKEGDTDANANAKKDRWLTVGNYAEDNQGECDENGKKVIQIH